MPAQTLLDYLQGGHPLAEFLDDFPTVTREQAVALLEQAKRDQNLQHQQNLTELDLAILVLVALRNDIDLLRPLMPQVRKVLSSVRMGEVLSIGS